MTIDLIGYLGSGAAFSALVATGAFLQKCKDNTNEIVALKERVTDLEAERTSVAALTENIASLEKRVDEIKIDVKDSLKEIREMFREQQIQKKYFIAGKD